LRSNIYVECATLRDDYKQHRVRQTACPFIHKFSGGNSITRAIYDAWHHWHACFAIILQTCYKKIASIKPTHGMHGPLNPRCETIMRARNAVTNMNW
jgi:hypothetical protein